MVIQKRMNPVLDGRVNEPVRIPSENGGPSTFSFRCTFPGCTATFNSDTQNLKSTGNLNRHWRFAHSGTPQEIRLRELAQQQSEKSTLGPAQLKRRADELYLDEKRPGEEQVAQKRLKLSTSAPSADDAEDTKKDLQTFKEMTAFLLGVTSPLSFIEHEDSRSLLSYPIGMDLSKDLLLGCIKWSFGLEKTEVKTKILEHISSGRRISLSTNRQVLSSGVEFMAVTCHYITDKWQDQEHLLAFLPIHKTFTDKMIAQKIFNVMRHYKVENSILSITQNGTNNDVYNELERMIRYKHPDLLEFTHGKGDIDCLLHVLNVSLQEFWKSFNYKCTDEITGEIDGSDCLAKAHYWSKILRIRKVRILAKLDSETRWHNVKTDTTDQWISTYEMLKSLLDLNLESSCLQKALLEARIIKEDYLLSSNDFEAIKKIVKTLDYVAAVAMESQSPMACASSSVLCALYQVILEFDQIIEAQNQSTKFSSTFKDACRMTSSKLKEFKKQFLMTDVLMIAMLFDPTINRSKLGQCLGFNWSEQVTLLSQLAISRNFRIGSLKGEDKCQDRANQTVGATSESSRNLDPSTIRRDPFFKFRANPNETASKEEIMTEVREFLKADSLSYQSASRWWLRKGYEYPELSEIARDYLAIPISSASSQKSFSFAEDMLPTRKTKFLYDQMRAMVLMKSWDKRSHKKHPDLASIQEDFPNLFSRPLCKSRVTEASKVIDAEESSWEAIERSQRFHDPDYMNGTSSSEDFTDEES